jgi:hypothetical protein
MTDEREENAAEPAEADPEPEPVVIQLTAHVMVTSEPHE